LCRTLNGMSAQAPNSSPNVMSADHQTEPEGLCRAVRIDLRNLISISRKRHLRLTSPGPEERPFAKNQGKDVMLTNCSDPSKSARNRGPEPLKIYFWTRSVPLSALRTTSKAASIR
jgi:hypothetical protein